MCDLFVFGQLRGGICNMITWSPWRWLCDRVSLTIFQAFPPAHMSLLLPSDLAGYDTLIPFFQPSKLCGEKKYVSLCYKWPLLVCHLSSTEWSKTEDVSRGCFQEDYWAVVGRVCGSRTKPEAGKAVLGCGIALPRARADEIQLFAGDCISSTAEICAPCCHFLPPFHFLFRPVHHCQDQFP